MRENLEYNAKHFESVQELGAYCKANRYYCKGDDGRSWYGGIDKEQAADLAIKGDDSAVPAAEKLLERFTCDLETFHVEDMPSVAGAYVVVPEALTGEPECMRLPMAVESPSAPLTVLVDLTCSAGIDADSMRRRGVAILALVMTLTQHRPISLLTFSVSNGHRITDGGDYTGDRAGFVSVRIETAPLDLASAAYALAHVGFFRSLHLGVSMHTQGGYGGWPEFKGLTYGQVAGEEYKARVLKYLEVDGDCLYIPAASVYDADTQQMKTDPEGWVRTMLERFGTSVEQ